MSLLNRVSSGLVFVDDFSTNRLDPRWTVSPSDDARYSTTDREGYLRMKHGDPDLYILTDSPRFDHVFEIDADYNPVRASDQGGLVAYRDKDTRIEMLEYYDPEKGTSQQWETMRFVRRDDLFDGFGSNDNGRTWELVGTSYLAAPKIGMVLHGIQESQSDTLDISEVRVYRDTKIHVGNLTEGMTVKILDGSGNVVGSETCKPETDYVKVDVSTRRMPMTGKLQLFSVSDILIAETESLTDIWGGDVFSYGLKLDLEVDEVRLRQDREFQLGNMQGGAIEKRCYIVNDNDVPIYNVNASVLVYSEYEGWQWVDIAPDVYQQPGTYRDNISIGTIQPKERVPMWMKITRQPHQQVASINDYKFRIMFESG